ncbi:hypothetical protein ACTHQ4_20125 [Alkalicoccobacillus gibsonii]|uniref:hypothetical protein n=1 Tax=Alkalicoccobacillus gibsonii TaxID=79881 RepID=UPI003F7CB812
MVKKKHTLTKAQADAYKTKAEGVAIQVDAWTPVMMRILGIIYTLLILYFGNVVFALV